MLVPFCPLGLRPLGEVAELGVSVRRLRDESCSPERERETERDREGATSIQTCTENLTAPIARPLVALLATVLTILVGVPSRRASMKD